MSTVKEALPHVKERRGSIVLIGSVAAFLPVTGNIAYNASKAAVHSIGQTLAAELHGTGVSVTTIGRVARFLTDGFGGYRVAIDRVSSADKPTSH